MVKAGITVFSSCRELEYILERSQRGEKERKREKDKRRAGREEEFKSVMILLPLHARSFWCG